MPDGAYNVVAVIHAGLVVRWLWARDQRARVARATGTAPARSSSAPSVRWVLVGVVAFVAYVVLWNVGR